MGARMLQAPFTRSCAHTPKEAGKPEVGDENVLKFAAITASMGAIADSELLKAVVALLRVVRFVARAEVTPTLAFKDPSMLEMLRWSTSEFDESDTSDALIWKSSAHIRTRQLRENSPKLAHSRYREM